MPSGLPARACARGRLTTRVGSIGFRSRYGVCLRLFCWGWVLSTVFLRFRGSTQPPAMPMPTHFEVTKTLLEAQMEAVRIYETTLGAEAGHQVALQKAMVTAQLAALQKLEAANGPSAARTAKRGTRKKVAKRSSAIKKRKAPWGRGFMVHIPQQGL